MLAWRLAQRRFARDRRGYGAAIFGGRWNQRNVAANYAGLSVEIAVLEKFVHTAARPVPDLVLVRIELPEDSHLYWHPSIATLPRRWNETPGAEATAAFGTAFLREARFLGLIVPSAVVPEARNIVINPMHLAFRNVRMRTVRAFAFDRQMFK